MNKNGTKRLNEVEFDLTSFDGTVRYTKNIVQNLKDIKTTFLSGDSEDLKPASEPSAIFQTLANDLSSVGDALKWLILELWGGFKTLFGLNDVGDSSNTVGSEEYLPNAQLTVWKRINIHLQSMFSTFSRKATQIQAEGLDAKIFTGGQMSIGTGLRIGFLGSLVAFAVYKVVKWVRGSKKEETVEALNSNVHEFKNKLNEGFDFSNNLIARILESENTTSNAVATIKKAKPVADELADFAQEAEEKKETEQSIIKKYGYWILGGIAAIAATFVYLGLFASSKAPYQQAWSGGKPVTPIKDPKPYQKAWSGPVKSATPTTDLTGDQDVVPGVNIS